MRVFQKENQITFVFCAILFLLATVYAVVLSPLSTYFSTDINFINMEYLIIGIGFACDFWSAATLFWIIVTFIYVFRKYPKKYDTVILCLAIVFVLYRSLLCLLISYLFDGFPPKVSIVFQNIGMTMVSFLIEACEILIFYLVIRFTYSKFKQKMKAEENAFRYLPEVKCVSRYCDFPSEKGIRSYKYSPMLTALLYASIVHLVFRFLNVTIGEISYTINMQAPPVTVGDYMSIVGEYFAEVVIVTVLYLIAKRLLRMIDQKNSPKSL